LKKENKYLKYITKLNKLCLLAFMTVKALNVNALPMAVPIDTESAVAKNDSADDTVEDEFRNDVSVKMTEQEIKDLKKSYISPYNYLQDPIDLNMGYDSRLDTANGTYNIGISVIAGENRPINHENMTFNTDVGELWGQTGRLGGFALGAGVTTVFNVNDNGSADTYRTTGQIAPTQAYINYQYSNKIDISVGNILITTPWVNSFGSAQGGTYAMGNNSYQGVLINVQALPSLLVTGYTAWGYLQYPNGWYGPQNFYNTTKGVLTNSQPTGGTSGVGITWNPVNSYTGQLWLYNFADYANMAYLNNSYHVDLTKLTSIDFGLQAFTQTSAGSAITNQVMSPNQTTTLGNISSNGLGAKIALNIGDNITSISFNNIFGNNGSYLNGGMVTPYTYGMEIDPLYTTPALTSLAELGSGYAYTIRNSTSFLDKSLKFNLSMSQFFINQVYASQVTQITEYDASLLYRIPRTNMNIWARMVYLQQPPSFGSELWQPRVIFNWTY
jgi:hypothetical protein